MANVPLLTLELELPKPVDAGFILDDADFDAPDAGKTDGFVNSGYIGTGPPDRVTGGCCRDTPPVGVGVIGEFGPNGGGGTFTPATGPWTLGVELTRACGPLVGADGTGGEPPGFPACGKSPFTESALIQFGIPSVQTRSVGEILPAAASWRNSAVDTGPRRCWPLM